MKSKSAILWFVVALMAYGPGGGPAAAVTGSEVVEKLQKNFSKYKSFAAEFEQQFYWAVLEKEWSRKGRIYTRQPKQFRLEIEGGDTFVADGQTIWAYSPQNEQAIASSYDDDLKTPWEILLDYSESFAPVAIEEVKLERRSCYLLTLKPQTTFSDIAQMRIWVDRKKWQLLKAEKVETNENITTYVLKDERIDKKLDDALFHFSPPAGTEVIDRRSLLGADESQGTE
jgi:chaperone LolA